jgi:hypothetical protein
MSFYGKKNAPCSVFSCEFDVSLQVLLKIYSPDDMSGESQNFGFVMLQYSFANFLLRLIGTVVVAFLIGRLTNCRITFVYITTLLLFGFIYLFCSLKIGC